MRRLLIACALLVASAIGGGAAEMGDDGLHKAPWMMDTFKNLAEDHAEAAAEGKRLMVLVEQRGCLYCKKMHEEVFSEPEIARKLSEEFFVVQLNMFGDVEVTDFDGTVLPEKDMVRRWGMMFTPTIALFGAEAPDAALPQAVAAMMPGAFSANMTRHLLDYVLEDAYAGDEPFQKYHARRLEEEGEI